VAPIALLIAATTSAGPAIKEVPVSAIVLQFWQYFLLPIAIESELNSQ